MIKKSQIGAFGENRASEYIQSKGYKILARNFKRQFGEIDIIVRRIDGTIIFVEVKTLLIEGSHSYKPEDNFTTQKRQKVNRMAQFFVGQYPHLINEDLGWQIDLIAVELFNDGSWLIRHYENI